jgi:acyl-CoA reductase-like NAD-dependent aldehyde dehydrogenase
MTFESEAQLVGDAEVLVVRSPADGRVVGTQRTFTESEVAAEAKRLRLAQPEWERLGPNGRSKYLLQWLDWIMDNEQHLVELIQAETGKSWGDSAFEPSVAIEVINYVTKNAANWLADQTVKPHGAANATKMLRLHVRPYQLVGVILPWNVPLGMPMMDVPGALAAGAAVLSKPSEMTPLTWLEAVRGWQEIGAPPVLGCVTGLGAIGEAVVDQVDMVQFTGSARTGRRVGVRAAERLIPSSLELGGKDAMIVLDDADVDRAVGGAVWGGLFNTGQACVSVERVYVHERVYDEFVAKLTEEVSRIRQGTDTDKSFSNEIGAMATASQVDIVERHVQDAVAKGARVTTGGVRGSSNGSYFAPTVIVGVDHTMHCMQEETFGPTLPVMKVRSEEEAIELANDSSYGLAGSVWTADPERAERVARLMETGGVCANNVLATVFQFPLPFGGWKSSGLGARMGGPNTVRKYCRQQAFVAERVHIGRELNWYPYKPTKSRVLARMIRLLGMHDWRRRLGISPRFR